ncbi:MAG: acetyl-CoA carboxylase biotin carboxyl carrier protein [Pseudomonadota bacterium]
MTKTTEQDVAFIQALADLLKASDLGEVEVERSHGDDDTFKVRLSRAGSAGAPVVMQAPAAPAPLAAPPPAAPTAAAVTPAAGADAPDLTNAVTSPMVGTVYLAAEPGAANFVAPGDDVEEGQTILIIEAMKTMNQIPAPRSGRVRTILVDNEEPVEFGEPLMIIE